MGILLKLGATCAFLSAWLCMASLVCATPPEYATFQREQRVDHAPAAEDLLRIWVVFVNQGDGILIQLPEKYGAPGGERLDVLVDGGTFEGTEDQRRMLRFVQQLYGASPMIEHVVISHHDSDHVAGLTRLLDETRIGVRNVYHNGLASYRNGARGFRDATLPAEAVVIKDGSRLTRGMAFVEGDLLKPEFLLDDRDSLAAAVAGNELQGVYDKLAQALVNRTIAPPFEAFDRAHTGAEFINVAPAPAGPQVEFDLIWPEEDLRHYQGRNWGYTINGNSVTFRLRYGDFAMLFTGDHNDESEEALLQVLGADPSVLECDVLKVPHHGSDHAIEEFFEAVSPVVSVVSLGNQGFKSKSLAGSRAWQHPSTDVIQWLGGAHRVYHTFLHERKFKWSQINSEQKRTDMIERAHVLIETDGTWFRLTELPAPEGPAGTAAGLHNPPTVQQTRRGNGTRWVRAR